jgi:hypothetical protein
MNAALLRAIRVLEAALIRAIRVLEPAFKTADIDRQQAVADALDPWRELLRHAHQLGTCVSRAARQRWKIEGGEHIRSYQPSAISLQLGSQIPNPGVKAGGPHASRMDDATFDRQPRKESRRSTLFY